MNPLYPSIVCILLLSSCYNATTQEQKELKKNHTTPQKLSDNGGGKPTLVSEKKSGETSEKTEKKKENAPRTAVQSLLAKLGKDVKIEFGELDNEITKQDTLVRTKSGDYKISYTTACLNDSLVPLEMRDFASGYSKSYRLVHNYQTSINMQHNGKPSGSRVISKEIFKNKMEQDFLDKAIIKHPQFVRFDEEKNEAIFQFLVGVPATDWVVLAGVNLSPQGNIRIIDVTMPKYE